MEVGAAASAPPLPSSSVGAGAAPAPTGAGAGAVGAAGGAAGGATGGAAAPCIVQGISVGTVAFYQGKKADALHSHRWTVHVRGANDENLGWLVEKVVFHLHDSFTVPSRELFQQPYEVTETGWGEFDIAVEIHLNEHFLRSVPPGQRPPPPPPPPQSQDEDGSPSTQADGAPNANVSTDPNVLVINHALRLYPADESAQSVKRPVVSETYEEIVIQDPTPAMRQRYTDRPRAKMTEYRNQQYCTFARGRVEAFDSKGDAARRRGTRGARPPV